MLQAILGASWANIWASISAILHYWQLLLLGWHCYVGKNKMS